MAKIGIDSTRREYQKILDQLSDPELISDREKFEGLMKKKKALEIVLEKQQEIEEIQKQIEENKTILRGGEDPELISLAQTESADLQKKERIFQEQLARILKEEKSSGPSSAIIEIRAGTGGEEAALFAGDLYRMYSKYASLKGWRQRVLDSHPTDLNGFKEVVFELQGNGAFDELKQEGGVHRVQRIPRTEKSGRVHTSTATVAVLAKPGTTEIKIRPDEIRVDYYRSSGPGGQNVQKRETAVRITHLKTGIVAASQNERNQLQNKENALSILSAKLLEKKNQEEQSKISGARKTQIGKAKRVEKIRTYNFPQDRITDHRIKKSWHSIESIMNGKMDNIVRAFRKNL